MASPNDSPLSAHEDTDTYVGHLHSLQIDPQDLEVDTGGTVRVKGQPHTETTSLPTLADLEIGDRLGAGSMGVVMSARQPNLDRDVAVKVAKPITGARHRLIREAALTGGLSHPNIVPIHDLRANPNGDPMLVMQHIEGIPWSKLLATGSRPLSFHLEVLGDVCQAVAFAHDRGVIHRDLKPSNVMVGDFGQVYVVDWGVALTIDEAADAPIAGTPGYMSPEAAAGEPLTPSTDVFSLGAILHEILTGRALYPNKEPLAALAAAYLCEPQTYDSGPIVLTQLCLAACSREVENRPENATEFRESVRNFQHYRASMVLLTEATELSQSVAQALRDTPVDPAAIREAGSGARMAYELALREWPDNDAARMGQANLTRVLARFELDQGHLGSVTELLSTLDVPDAELDRALQAAVEAREVAAGELDALKHSRDMRFGAELRRRQAITWSIGLGLFHLVCGGLTWAEIARPEHGTLIAFSVFGLIASSYGNYDLRRHSTSEASLRVANSAAAMPFFMLGFWIFAWWLDLDFGPALGLALFLQTAMVLQSALLQSVSTVAASAAGGTFAIAAILWPEAAWFMVAFGTTIQTAGIGIAVSTAVDDDSAIG